MLRLTRGIDTSFGVPCVAPTPHTRSWLSPLLSLGYSRPLQESDLGELAFIDRAGNVASRLRHAIDSSSSMWWAMAHAFGGSMVYPVACKLVGDLLGFVQVRSAES